MNTGMYPLLVSDVSIILPTLELNDFFFQTLESILKVKYNDLEVIVIHDNQDSHLDDTLDFEIRFKEAGHKFIVTHATSSGLVSALNYGMDLSKREFICRIDSDDLILPDRIRLQVNYLKKNPKVAVVGGQIKYMDSSGLVKDKVSHYPTSPSSTRLHFERGCFLAHPAAMFRRAEITALGGYRAYFKSAEDLDLWLRVLEVRDISNLSEDVIIYREHSGQMSSKLSEVNLYTRVAFQSSKLRRSGISQDLPQNVYDVEKWLSNESTSSIVKKYLNRFLLAPYSRFCSKILSKLKLARFNREYSRTAALLLLALLIMPKNLLTEILSFLKFRLRGGE